MTLDNLAVNHKMFGKGTVVSCQGKYMTVKFDRAQKIFVYPDAFENFLTLEDGTVSEEITNDINAVKQCHFLHLLQERNLLKQFFSCAFFGELGNQFALNGLLYDACS